MTMKVRLRVEGSLLCDATDLDDAEAFEAVLDGVTADARVHASEIEALELSSVEEGPEPLVTADVGEMAQATYERLSELPAFQESVAQEEFEAEHGLEIYDCSTWPDDLVRDLLKFLEAWARGNRAQHDYEVLTMARGLGLLGTDDEADDERLTDRGRLFLLGWRAGKQGW